MVKSYRAGIMGTGLFVPRGRLTNADLESMVDTSDGWITTRTGIKERRRVSGEQACSDLATAAGRMAVERARLSPGEIDLIIVGTVTPDHLLPSTACLVQRNLGAAKAGAFDVSAACNGFVTALSTGAKFVQTGECRNVLVIGSEALTRFVNYEDRTSCILFGDGAGAAVIGRDFHRGEILDARVHADGNGWDYMILPAGGSRMPASAETVANSGHMIIVRGREVYKFAVNRMVELVQEARGRHPDIPFGMVIPHQVNLRIIESARERLALEEGQIAVNIQKYGNTSAASIPIMLHEAIVSRMLDGMAGKLIVLCAFGAGLNWGFVTLRW